MNFKFLRILLPLTVALFIVSCEKNSVDDPTDQEAKGLVADFDYTVIWEWHELYMVIDKDALGYRPLPGPRANAYMGIAAYETAVPGMPSFNSMKNQWGPELKIPVFPADQKIHWPTALNASYGYMMNKFFFKTNYVAGSGHLTNSEAIRLIGALHNGLENKYKAEINDNVVFNDSKAWGEKVASAVWAWSVTDAYGHESDLNPLNNDKSKEFFYDWKAKGLDAAGKPIPGRWVPTNDNPNGGMFPFGGRCRTFATTEAQKLCVAPIPFSDNPSSRFYAEALNVYNSSNSTMSYEQRWVAEFWSDDIFGQTFSPPTRLVAVLDQVMGKEKCNLEKAVESAAKLGLALNDFGVSAWHSKYVYNLERPEHYIKRVIDPKWEPILTNTVNGAIGITPAFPAYPSGHATFGGGGGAILAHLFGQNYEWTDLCHKGRSEFIGTPRTFASFEDAGFENAMSRVPLGVHFQMDCLAGVDLGKGVARRVLALPWKK